MNYVPLQRDALTASGATRKVSTTSTTDPLLRNLSEKVLLFVLSLDTASEKIVSLFTDTATVNVQGSVCFVYSYPIIFDLKFTFSWRQPLLLVKLNSM